ncbi:Queuine tRNA-ribosyltransferase [Nymphaea thermarum]|nr:Queuine tRNA-ribosyltransferase [Nymphaea thermarum]
MALCFEVLGKFNRARAAQLTLPHFVCHTPLFMPVGTQGTIKGLTSCQLEDIGCQIILGNTYHLALRPGADLIDEMDGLHKFMNWPRALLTDSGGFQMVNPLPFFFPFPLVSLLHLADITEKGVTFQSPVDGKPMLLTPEESIQIQVCENVILLCFFSVDVTISVMPLQNKIGADIIMALDDVVRTTITGPRVEEAMYRTLRWIDRCIAAHKRPDEQNLFGIVQGGLDPVLRDICVKGLVKRNLPGYAIGGLAGGEEKDSFWRVVAQCTAALPEDKPRYVMGVGYPLDIVVCSALGADMYDCVYPTRTARFGTALVPEGLLKLKHAVMADDIRPIDPTCTCMVCQNYTRAYIHSLVTKDAMGSQLLTYHNLAYMMRLSSDLHTSIIEGRFPEFVCNFLKLQFPKGDVPEWVCNAMEVAGIDISECCAPFCS